MEKFKLLKYIAEDGGMSQRTIAEKVGVSLGKINAIIKECIHNEEIDMITNNGETKYLLTDKGFKSLQSDLKDLKETMVTINQEEIFPVKQAVILAAGRKKDFDIPVAGLKLEDETIIEKNIRILKENGIKKIIVVAGYNYGFLADLLKNESNVVLVNNERYNWTGNMTSLALASNHVEEDFLLIEGDLVFESTAIIKLLEDQRRDVLLITNESGSGDEGFVQLKDGYLFKLAKDIHQFNRIDGEMIGIAKISYKLYKMMLKEFEGNINPYLNYEYMILDVARDYKVPCLKLDDLAWSEVDTEEQYKKVSNYIYSKIKRREKEKSCENIRNIVHECLDIPYEDITEVIVAGGMTNKNYKVCIRGDYYILRLPGLGTEKMISRKYEMINSKLGADEGINVDVLYFNEESGIKISKFIDEAETLTGRSSKKEENMKLVAGILKKLHYSKINLENRFNVFEEIVSYENILKELNGAMYDDYSIIRPRVMRIQELIKEYGEKLVPSHNDTVPENFVKDREGRIYLIDWEYSGMNEEMWDLAAHSLESDFSEEEEELFLTYYFGGKVKREDKIRVLMNQICQDFLWSVWTLIKESEGDDFGNYGIDRYNRAKRNLDKLDKLI
ncbi:winged helix-turn-helix transcriptional regulator [Clostridium paraputrificum]|uniref:winged helix-turn-helix transcriptional regulator n=1 Tax=Clostridium TaxID=1485 RepID=UPI003D333AE5